MDLYNLRKIWNPAFFQGNNKNKQYFEGWYFKLVSSDRQVVWAIIPGISLGRKNEGSYPFIQLINGKNGKSYFIKYHLDEFQYSRRSFEVSIANNKFSGSGISLDIHDNGTEFRGKVDLQYLRPYPVRLLSPGVMGWYRFVPTMECYHGIVSMNHRLAGELSLAGKKYDFTGGKGYIEKDWGKSMPHAWIWMQSNHFKREDLSVSISIANIPWKKSAFTGFLIILSAEDHYYIFTTYNRSRITKLLVRDGKVVFEVRNRHYKLSVNSMSTISGDLKAPVEGEMKRTISESIGAEVGIQLRNKSNDIILEDTGSPAGMEIAGEVNILSGLLEI
jgi:hypothetical protein